jgi:aspartate racemase
MNTSATLAVIGGMGPLASAAFVNTVYERAAAGCDQEMPRLVLWSDPSFPNGTTALFDGPGDALANHLEHAIARCDAMGRGQVVICCVASHAALPLLPGHLRSRIVSLVDVALAAAIESERPRLLLTSLGARRMRVFESHPQWPEASEWLRWPDEEDHQRVDDAICAISRQDGVPQAVVLIRSLLRKYGLSSFVVASAELHMVQKYWRRYQPVDCIDPFQIAADRIAASMVVGRQQVKGSALGIPAEPWTG